MYKRFFVDSTILNDPLVFNTIDLNRGKLTS